MQLHGSMDTFACMWRWQFAQKQTIHFSDLRIFHPNCSDPRSATEKWVSDHLRDHNFRWYGPNLRWSAQHQAVDPIYHGSARWKVWTTSRPPSKGSKIVFSTTFFNTRHVPFQPTKHGSTRFHAPMGPISPETGIIKAFSMSTRPWKLVLFCSDHSNMEEMWQLKDHCKHEIGSSTFQAINHYDPSGVVYRVNEKRRTLSIQSNLKQKNQKDSMVQGVIRQGLCRFTSNQYNFHDKQGL